MGLIDQIEVLRGPSASLYGNASGGVIYIKTLDEINEKVRFNYTMGSSGLHLTQLLVDLSKEENKGLLAINYTQSDGYRTHSGFSQLQTNYKNTTPLGDHNSLQWQFNYTHSPKAYDAGGVTLDQLQENPRAARSANLDFDAREAIDHFKTAAQLKTELNNASLSNHVYLANRSFTGYLPFESGGVSAFNRWYWGLGSAYQTQLGLTTLELGWSHDQQEDQRKRFDNIVGTKGSLQEEQSEHYSNTALYLTSTRAYGSWNLHSGIRADHIGIWVGDTDQKQSYLAINPSLGLHYQLQKNSGIYGRYSESFQTPTLSELSNNPNGTLSFNPELRPSKAKNLELGFKHHSPTSQFELALFSIRSTDELIAYSIEDYPGRTFYNNAGKTIRNGIELSYIKIWRNFQFQQSYTYSDFRFDNTENTLLPGIPKHNAYNRLRQQFSNGFQLALTSVFWGELYATSSNSVRVKDQFYSHLSMSKSFEIKSHLWDLKLGINNIWNSDYYDNIRVNAWGKRYYEPAPKRTLYIGISWGVN